MSDAPYGHIYLVRNLLNGKVYVGQTTLRPARRWSAHVSGAMAGGGNLFGRAIRKHGKESFSMKVLAACADRETLNKLEKYFITQVFRSDIRVLGYNLMSGAGSFGKHSEATKQKIRMLKLGKKCSPETRAKMSASQKAIPRAGEPLSAEHRAKLSASRRAFVLSQKAAICG